MEAENDTSSIVDKQNELDEFTDDNDLSFDSVRVFEHTGTKIYKYFRPDELFHMSLTSRRVYNHISQHLIHVMKQNLHLPLMIDLPPQSLDRMYLDEGMRDRLQRWGAHRPRTQATITSGNLFPTKESFVNYIVQIILMGSDLRAIGSETYNISNDACGQTQEETINIVREGLNAGCSMRLELSNHSGSVRLQPTAYNIQTPGILQQSHVGEGLLACEYTETKKHVAKYLLDAYFEGSHGYKSSAKSWLHYILAQPGTHVRYISCIFVHPNYIESITTEGLIISNSAEMSVTARFKRRM